MSDDLDTRIKSALHGIPEDVIFNHRQNFGPEHPIRRILISEVQRLIEEHRNTLETCEIDNVKEAQGTIKGFRKVIGVINSVGVKNSQK